VTRETCKACGRVSAVGFSVSDEMWQLATGGFPFVLCLACFTARADDAMLPWDREIQFWPVSLVSHWQDYHRERRERLCVVVNAESVFKAESVPQEP
jgi:hypothetical protein